MNDQLFRTMLLGLAFVGGAHAAAGDTTTPSADEAKAITWHDDYATAVRQAMSQRCMLWVFFHSDEFSGEEQKFESVTCNDDSIRSRLASQVCLKLPVSWRDPAAATETPLVQHPSFLYMRGQPGLASIDFRNSGGPHWHQVVTQMPFRAIGHPGVARMQLILDLPSGSLTQRTMTYAVRIHAESPRSTTGIWDPMLADEARKHSQHQADIQVQGHHHWNHRFQQITYKLPDRLTAQEVCAESWPGEDLVDAAIECVDSWRFSSGHWRAVRRFQPRFGYDMKRGRNGIWYGTGIFGNRGG